MAFRHDTTSELPDLTGKVAIVTGSTYVHIFVNLCICFPDLHTHFHLKYIGLGLVSRQQQFYFGKAQRFTSLRGTRQRQRRV